MQNLKVKFNLVTPVMINRFSTFDSILTGALLWTIRKNDFKPNGIIADIASKVKQIKDFDNTLIDLKELYPILQNYIEIKHDVISGSIWFIEKDTDILINNEVFIKKIEPEKIIEFTGEIDNKDIFAGGSGPFRQYRFKEEVMFVDSIYFYVRADKDFIKEITDGIKFIGKKSALYHGKVKSAEITEISSDKSFMIYDNTPARPLPCKDFNIDSNKVVFWRVYPPYNDKRDQAACYMPNSILYETEYVKPEGYNSIKPDYYISPSDFALYKNLDNIKKPEGEHYCIFCGQKTKNSSNIKKLTKGSGFNDYPYVMSGKDICDSCFETQKVAYTNGECSNIFIYNGGYKYFMGTKLDKTLDKGIKAIDIRKDIILNESKYPLPFMFTVRAIEKQQHTVFKTKVSISDEMIVFQWGNKMLYVDIPLLKDAVKDLQYLSDNYDISKSNINALSIEPNDKKSNSVYIKNEHYNYLKEFYKKYPLDIRLMLNWIEIDKKEKPKKSKVGKA